MARIKPHLVSGLYFCRPDGRAYSLVAVEHAFVRIREEVRLDDVKAYDLRGTFAMHRAVVVRDFRQLQAEMGHSNPNSIQSYLDEAANLHKEESIFYEPNPGRSGTLPDPGLTLR